MSIVKEYYDEKTKIKIHDDYITNEEKEVKEIIISLVINSIKNDNIDCNIVQSTLKYK